MNTRAPAFRSMLPAFVTFAALAGIVPLLLVRLAEDAREVPLALVAALILSGVQFTRVVFGTTRRLMEMVFWLFSYIFMGMAPIVQIATHITPATTPKIEESLIPVAAGIVLTGIVMFSLGTLLHRKKCSQVSLRVRTVNEARANVLTAVSLLLALYYIMSVQPGTLFLARSERGLRESLVWPDSSVGALVAATTFMGLLVSFVAQIYVRRQRRRRGLKAGFVLPMLILVLLAVISNPISTARYVFGSIALGVLAALGAYRTVNRYRVVSLSALVGLVTVFPLLDAFRYSLDVGVEPQGFTESLTGPDFDSFDQIVNAFEVVQTRGLHWFNQLLGVVLFWVPRSIWSEKPLDTGAMLGLFKGYPTTNLSAPIWAELFVNAGWIGVILGMLVLGWAVARFDSVIEHQLENWQIPGVLGCTLPFYFLILLRGSLLQAMAGLSVMVLFSLFVENPRVPSSRSVSNQVEVEACLS